MIRNRIFAAITCMAMLLSAAIPTSPMLTAFSEDETAAEGKEQEFGHYGPLTYEIKSDSLKIIACDLEAITAEIPPEIDGMPVTEVAFNTFGSCSDLETVVYNTSADLPYDLFRNTSLKHLTLGADVKDVSHGFLNGCEDVHLVIETQELSSSFNSNAAISELTLDGELQHIAFRFSQCPNLKRVNIGAGIKIIDPDSFLWCDALEGFQVAQDNERYYAEDGILYDSHADRCNLLKYPAGRADESFTVPDQVYSIASMAFHSAHLREITLPEQIQDVWSESFSNTPQLENIFVAGEYSLYRSFDGVLFDCRNGVNQSTLVKYPNGKTAESYKVPENTAALAEKCFAENTVLSQIHLPTSLAEIGSDAFGKAALTDVYFAGTQEQWDAVTIASDNEALANAVIHFESAPADDPEQLAVDLTGDGITNIVDIIVMQKFMLGRLKLPEKLMEPMDVNGDGNVNPFDLAIFKRRLLHS